MMYLDTTVFANALLDEGKKGDSARKLILCIEQGKKSACTSLLAIDELLWVMKKAKGREAAVAAGKSLLSLQHLTLLDIDMTLMHETLEVMQHTNLKPRDALHYATMRLNDIRTIVSDDSDFDSIEGINRKGVESTSKT